MNFVTRWKSCVEWGQQLKSEWGFLAFNILLMIEKKRITEINYLRFPLVGQDAMPQYSIAFANENRAVFIWALKSNWFASLRFTIGLKKLAPLLIQSELKPNPSWLVRTRFPALGVSYARKRQVLIGSLYCLCPLWLVRLITLVLVLRKPLYVSVHLIYSIRYLLICLHLS